MPFAMPMWPPLFLTNPVRVAPAALPTRAPVANVVIRRRWMIVDDTVRREVDEREYRAALASCNRIEVARYPHEDVVTHLCYLAADRN